MSQTNRGERLQIAILGMRNAGKSSLMNALLGQDISIISPVAGTTTDPVAKTMELHPLGPVTLVDGAGIDEDESELGQARAKRSLSELPRSDLVIILLDATRIEENLPTVSRLREQAMAHAIPCVLALNKCDLCDDKGVGAEEELRARISAMNGASFVRDSAMHDSAPHGSATEATSFPIVRISAHEHESLAALRTLLFSLLETQKEGPSLVHGLLPPGGFALLVIPIDSSAPKGRLILPQMQTMRAILDYGASFAGTQADTLKQCLDSLGRKPDIVITDSQAFAQAAAILPQDIALTSFSILLARAKGDLAALVHGVRALDGLKEHDRVLIAEACSHHAQADDIGTVKIPRWLREKCAARGIGDIQIDHCSGRDFPDELSQYRVIIHCGACMLTARETRARIARALDAGAAITNYGITIAWRFGILDRALAPFKAGGGF